ncbi:MAG: response regulator [Desulfobacteraceae bacterium]|nr:response regulator [Desulfobacteraceae bacterium]
MNNNTQPSVLVTDDNIQNLQVLSEMLRSRNYKVATVKDGFKALKFAKTKNPDIILLDIIMPEMDGFEVCRQLKSKDNTKDIPIIFISALNETEDIVKGFRAGGADYITKPFQSEEVLARIEAHLNLRRLQKHLQEKNAQLKDALEKVKTLKGLIPICANCKKIRDDKGYWHQVEAYIREHSEAEFSHGICSECLKKLYPEVYEEKKYRFPDKRL